MRVCLCRPEEVLLYIGVREKVEVLLAYTLGVFVTPAVLHRGLFNFIYYMLGYMSRSS